MLAVQAPADAADDVLDILADVAQKNSTQWSIVYDQKRGRIYYRTRKRQELRSIDTTSLDFNCGTPVKVLDIDAKESGDVTRQFKNYRRELNRDLIERAFSGTDFLKNVPGSAKDRAADFPERFTCSLKKPGSAPDSRSFVASTNFSGYLFTALPLYYIYALTRS